MDKKDLRVVFMGTPEIAVISLDAILENGYSVVGVITAPDKPAGRGRKLHFSEVKKYALDKGLHLLQPENLKDPAFNKELQLLNPNVQVVVAFRMLPEMVLTLPAFGTFNMHASLLPQYRGAAPINWAIINGENRSGVTTFFLDKKIDTGRIIDQKETQITQQDTAGSLHDRLALLGAQLVVETLEGIASENIKTIHQEQLVNASTELKKAPKIFKEDCRIQWSKPANQISNLIKGLNPFPGAFTEISLGHNDMFYMKIFEAEPIVENHTFEPGKLLTDNKHYIKISTKDGFLEIKNMQAAGKKRMKTQDFLRGYDFQPFTPIN